MSLRFRSSSVLLRHKKSACIHVVSINRIEHNINPETSGHIVMSALNGGCGCKKVPPFSKSVSWLNVFWKGKSRHVSSSLWKAFFLSIKYGRLVWLDAMLIGKKVDRLRHIHTHPYQKRSWCAKRLRSSYERNLSSAFRLRAFEPLQASRTKIYQNSKVTRPCVSYKTTITCTWQNEVCFTWLH